MIACHSPFYPRTRASLEHFNDQQDVTKMKKQGQSPAFNVSVFGKAKLNAVTSTHR